METLKNPTSEDVMNVIEKLKTVLPKHIFQRRKLDMECGNVCGTSLCHGGWYFVASSPEMKKERKVFYNFSYGAELMAKDLKFEDAAQLCRWASHNFEIWGNACGVSMFSTKPVSFTHPIKRPDGARSIQHIIDHWTEVHDRIKEIETKAEEAKRKLIEDNEKQNQYLIDATKEIMAIPLSEGGMVDVAVKKTELV